MPGGDGTGPMRQGPLTGGGFGPCGGGRGRTSMQGDLSGRGGAGGGGRGWRNRRWAPDWSGWRRALTLHRRPETRSAESEEDQLQQEKSALESKLEQLTTRIAGLRKPE